MSTGLLASTVTPGSTAPDASLTTPVMAACANAAAGTSKTTSNTAADRLANARIGIPPHRGVPVEITSVLCRMDTETKGSRSPTPLELARVYAHRPLDRYAA